MNPERLGELAEIARNPHDSTEIRALARAIVSVEIRQRAAVQAVAREAGVNPETLGVGERPTTDDRIDALCDCLEARLTGDPWALWLSRVVPEEVASALDSESARRYAGLDDDEWTAVRETILERMRTEETIDDAEYTDDQLIAAHLQGTFGVTPAEWDEWVLGYSPDAAVEAVAAGVLNANTAALEQLQTEL